MSDRQFPIQRTWQRNEQGDRKRQGPSSIPYGLIGPHERQALINHGGQSLQELASRGGLCACEACAVIEDRPWRQFTDHDNAVRRLEALIAAHAAKDKR